MTQQVHESFDPLLPPEQAENMGERPGNHELALMLIDEYIHFPPSAAA